jgi:predicted PurR-regulated permease PerM
MNFARPITFWIAMLAAVIAVVVLLLREVLLPFVAGAVLAYLLDPLATRLKRLEMNRLVATLAIVGLFIVGVVALIILTAPIIVEEIAHFIDSFPLYVKQLQGLATDPSRPWLSKIVGEGLGQVNLNTVATISHRLSGSLTALHSEGGSSRTCALPSGILTNDAAIPVDFPA